MIKDLILFAAICLLPMVLGYATLFTCRRLQRSHDYAFRNGDRPLQSTLTLRKPR